MGILLWILIAAVTFGLLPASIMGAIDLGIGLMTAIGIMGLIGWLIFAFLGLGGLIFYVAIVVLGLGLLISLMLQPTDHD